MKGIFSNAVETQFSALLVAVKAGSFSCLFERKCFRFCLFMVIQNQLQVEIGLIEMSFQLFV